MLAAFCAQEKVEQTSYDGREEEDRRGEERAGRRVDKLGRLGEEERRRDAQGAGSSMNQNPGTHQP